MNIILIVWIAIPIAALMVSRVYRNRVASQPEVEKVPETFNTFLDPLDYLEIEQEHIMVEHDRPVTQTDVRQLVLHSAPTEASIRH